jgi:N-formylglutamate amidohydrolase
MNVCPRNIERHFFAALVGIVLSGTAVASYAESLILCKAGNLPIVLTAPHGGQESVPGVRPRTGGTTLRDADTLELTEAIAKRITEALGNSPYVVAARFSRRFIDANRAEAEAFETPEAKSVYSAYHNCIRDFVSDVKRNFPEGALLLDIHGQSDDPRVIHRGTRNGSTVSRLVQRHGPAALLGERSILGYLQSKGYRVFPSSTQIGEPSEDRRFMGGYTVSAYGSNKSEGIDAIQVEIGKYLRSDRTLADHLAKAIVIFYRAYLVTQAD